MIYKNLEFQIDWGLKVEGHYVDYCQVIRLLHPQLEWHFEGFGDYQGDWFALGISDSGEYYYHNGTYGSCSVCDWLQSIATEQDALDFLSAMDRIVEIGSSPEEAVQYLEREKQNTWDERPLEKLIMIIREEL